MTEQEHVLKSKVIVYEPNADVYQQLKVFLEEHGLIGLKDNANTFNKVFLDANIDLGAVFISLADNNHTGEGLDLIRNIYAYRPELPIIVRVENQECSQLESVRHIIVGSYQIDDLSPVKQFISDFLFNRYYPSPLVHGIQEITKSAFESSFEGCSVQVSSPYLVHDRIIYGEVFSLIPLESNWCRGHMMLQTTDDDVLHLIRAGKTVINSCGSSFRDVNDLLNEITNLIWGGIKARFFNSIDDNETACCEVNTTQVPILVNHNHRFITFGSREPQLCFHYEIKDEHGNSTNISMFQKMVFNLNWDPEKMIESDQLIDEIIGMGELELF